MRLLAGLLYASAAIAIAGLAKGVATTDASATGCSLELEGGKSENDTMHDAAVNCTYKIAFKHMGRDPSDETIRTTLATFCGRLPELRQCLDELEPNARACLDETQRTRYRLYRHFIETNLEIACEDHGADIAVVYRSTVHGKPPVLKGCRENATAQAEEIDAVDPNAFVLQKYEEMRRTVECLEEHKRRGDDSDWAITMCTKTMDRMKCVKDGAEVLCKTIVGDH